MICEQLLRIIMMLEPARAPEKAAVVSSRNIPTRTNKRMSPVIFGARRHQTIGDWHKQDESYIWNSSNNVWSFQKTALRSHNIHECPHKWCYTDTRFCVVFFTLLNKYPSSPFSCLMNTISKSKVNQSSRICSLCQHSAVRWSNFQCNQGCRNQHLQQNIFRKHIPLIS